MRTKQELMHAAIVAVRSGGSGLPKTIRSGAPRCDSIAGNPGRRFFSSVRETASRTGCAVRHLLLREASA